MQLSSFKVAQQQHTRPMSHNNIASWTVLGTQDSSNIETEQCLDPKFAQKHWNEKNIKRKQLATTYMASVCLELGEKMLLEALIGETFEIILKGKIEAQVSQM